MPRDGGPPLLAVATGSYLGEGFDCPALDTLFLVAPIAFKGLGFLTLDEEAQDASVVRIVNRWRPRIADRQGLDFCAVLYILLP